MHRSSIGALLAFTFAACSGAQTGDDGPDRTESADGTDDGVGGVCGNGIAEGEEVCDGADLAGSTCADVPGFIGGTLGCATDCNAFDASMCEGDPSGPLVRFNEVSSSDVTDGPYAGAGDAIELYNAGMVAADISGYLLSDESDFPPDKTYAVPAGTMLAPGAFLVFIKLDEETMEGDYPFGISSTEEQTLGLATPDGALVDSVTFNGADAQISWCRLPDGNGEWAFCVQTFGEANMEGGPLPDPVCGNDVIEDGEQCDGSDLGGADCTTVGPFIGGELGCDDACQLDTAACEVDPSAALVVINELSSTTPDEIELYNAGTEAADISGWILTDDIANPADPYDADADTEKLLFPAGTTIAPGGFLVMVEGPIPDHPFGLSSDGDALTLLDADLGVVDHVAYGLDEAATSYCRVPDGSDGEWQADCMATFGDPNAN